MEKGTQAGQNEATNMFVRRREIEHSESKEMGDKLADQR